MKRRSSTRRAHPTLPCCFGEFRVARRRAGPRAACHPPLEHLAMTSSRSRASRNSVLAALIVWCAVAGVAGVAHAERKRVVVLEFEGPKGGRFHDDVVKLIKKTHTVVPTDTWNGT